MARDTTVDMSSQHKEHNQKNPLEDADVARAFVKTAAQLSRSLNEQNNGTYTWHWLGCCRTCLLGGP
jgi:hypothetical protein